MSVEPEDIMAEIQDLMKMVERIAERVDEIVRMLQIHHES